MAASAGSIATGGRSCPFRGLSRRREQLFRTPTERTGPVTKRPGRQRAPVSRPVSAVVEDARQFLESSNEVDSAIPSSPYNGKTAVVVGAGPCGSMTGLLLARRGFNVKIFEKRGDPSGILSGNQRSIPNILNPVVTKLLVGEGVQLATHETEEGLPQFAGILVGSPGSIRVVASKDVSHRVLAERHAIAHGILSMGKSSGLPNLEYTFDTECQDVDLSSKTVTFSNQEGKLQRVAYDLLIGADGANSEVREALQAAGHVGVVKQKTTRTLISIRNLSCPKSPSSRDFVEKLTMGCFAAGGIGTFNRIPVRLLAYKTQAGLLGLVSIYENGWKEAFKGRELEAVAAVSPPWFPKEWVEPFAEQLMNAQGNAVGPIIYCSSYIGPGAALLGDAGHAATPVLGIGSNRAILDAKDLDDALGAANGDIPQALDIYDRTARPQVAAIQKLELIAPDCAIEGRKPIVAAFHPLLNKVIEVAGNRVPGLPPQPVFVLLSLSKITPIEGLWVYRYFAIAVIVAALSMLGGGALLLSRFL